MAWQDIIGQDAIKTFLKTAVTEGRLPNAYLFFGPEGVGKEASAIEVARVLNCEAVSAQQTAEACGVCNSCKKITDLTHDNLQIIFPVEAKVLESNDEEQIDKLKALYATKRQNLYFKMRMDKATGILTAQVQDIIEKSIFKPFGGKKRVIIISQADELREDAANKFLKILEEPPEYLLFILVSSRPEKILPTILSRCQPVRFKQLAAAAIQTRLESLQTADAGVTDIAFAANYSRGNFAEAVLISGAFNSDAEMPFVIKDIRDEVIDFLRCSVVDEKSYDLIKKIEAIAQSKKEKQREYQLRFLNAMLLMADDLLKYKTLSGAAELANKDASETIARFTKSFPNTNYSKLSKEIENAIYFITRNANATLVLADLAIKLKTIIRK
jgi:DNA polymerase-3 subunit delta'